MFRLRPASVGGSLALVVGLAWLLAAVAAVDERPSEPAELAERLVTSLSTRSALCVHVGVSDGGLAVGLAKGGQHLVHGLATDAEALHRARQKIEDAGLSGVVTIEPGSCERLPYADNLVDLLVADNLRRLAGQGFQVSEALRVLQPGGVAWLGEADEKTLSEQQLRDLVGKAGEADAEIEIVRRHGLWARITKPRPSTMDQWTHPRRDGSGNPVSTDKQVGVPTGVRWVAGPNWPTGYRKSSVPGVVTTGETLVYVFEDEVQTESGPKPQNSLIARDPFHGLMLWKRGTVRGPAPLVCVGQRVYTVIEDGGPLAALDAGTGEVLRTYDETRAPQKAVYLDGRLIVELPEGLGCLDAETGELQWRLEAKPKHFVAGDGFVFAHADDLRRGGDSELFCLDLKSGSIQWRKSTADWAKGSCDLILYHKGVLVAATSKANHAVAADDGRLLWSYEYPLIGHGGSYAKVLCMDGLVWVHAASFEGKKQYAWEGLDPQTGDVVKRVVQPADYTYKHRCSYDVATERYFLCGSMDFADLETGEYEHFDAARNSCRTAGVIPANGLVYTFPHACGCYAMLRGFLGLATDTTPASAEVLMQGERLVKGPAFGQELTSASAAEAAATDWPTYRQNARRSGSTSDPGPARLEELWSAEISGEAPASWSAEWDQKDGGRLSSPVVAEGLALVAAADQHKLMALDAASGAVRWTFMAGGRIDCPPTVYRGLCLLGSRDGWVYCLRARDGALAWRFQAAPQDRRIMAYGQLESPWPVVGGVLVYDGLAYFTVGRHSGSDGGLFIGALEPETGRLVWARKPEEHKGVPDVLNGDEGTVQMASSQFDARSGEPSEARKGRLQGGRLGLLNDAWYERPIAMRKNLQLWSTETESGQMLAFNEAATCVFRACTSVAGGDGKMSGHALLSGKQGRDEWSVKMPLDVRLHAMALAPQRLYVAGLLRDEKSSEPPALVVRMYDLEGGKLESQAAIPSPPVHDGMAVTGRRVYIATQSGKLICVGEK
jgi:outer membrane protein assembly factor BamB